MSLTMVEVMAPEGPWIFHRLSVRDRCRESKKLAEECGRSAEEAESRRCRGYAVDLRNVGPLNELQE